MRKALDYAIQIARGPGAAHEKGIVHRDLKPENLFATRDGRVKILDFGLAKLKQPEERGEKTNLPTATAGTEPGVVMGTMGYMAPEQVRGRSADQRSDIFSFGAILYAYRAGKQAGYVRPTSFRQLSFRRGWIPSALIPPDPALLLRPKSRRSVRRDGLK